MGLDTLLAGSRLTKIITYPSGRYRSTLPKQTDNVKWPLTVDAIACKGKLIIFDMTDSTGAVVYAFSTLGMAGQWLTEKPSSHLALELIFRRSDGSDGSIYYADQRHFGTFAFEHDERAALKRFNAIAAGFYGNYVLPLSDFQLRMKRWNHDYLLKRLMDQKSLASQVGNYLAAEIFYTMRLHPKAKCGDLSPDAVKKLYDTAASFIQRAYEGGTSRRPLEKPASGKVCGADVLQLQVYKQDRDPLNHVVHHDEGVHKRTIHWVPEVQTMGSPL